MLLLPCLYLWDKNPHLRTIVNKVRKANCFCKALVLMLRSVQVGSIESEFRVPEFDLIAGEPSLLVRQFNPL